MSIPGSAKGSPPPGDVGSQNVRERLNTYNASDAGIVGFLVAPDAGSVRIEVPEEAAFPAMAPANRAGFRPEATTTF